MCGIAGEIRFDGGEPDPAVIARMTDVLRHRGPDGEGYLQRPGVALGHRRLSIVDLAHGAQPMANEAGDVHVVFNGEIYNAPSLMRRLQAAGHRFATRSDTEVLVHLYEERGPAMMEDLRGMFAFALWDETNRRGLVVRDRLGIKPLYYMADGARLVFGSELKALVEASGFSPVLDPAALEAYLALHYIPAPLTIYSGVRKLPSGHYLEVAGDRVSEHRYWAVDIDRVRPPLSEGQAIAEFRALLEDVVEEHLMSDVPVGIFLSGGMDSSIIAALTARKSREPLATFTIRFEDPRYDEGPYARALARHIGSHHTEAMVKADAVSLLSELVRAYDEPFGDPAALPGYHLAQLGARHVKVCLSGDGGDELFAGYDRYARTLRFLGIDRLPGPARRALAHVGAHAVPEHRRGHDLLKRIREPLHVRYLREFGGFDASARAALIEPDLRRNEATDDAFLRHYFVDGNGERDPLTRMQWADLSTYLPECILTKVDRIAMAHSLEVRPPLLDHRVVDAAFSFPPSMRIRDGQRKWILRAAGEDLLPPGFLDRRKGGFSVPLREWFRTDLRAFATATLLGPDAATRGILRPPAVERVLELHAKGQRDFADRIWSLLVLEHWCRAHLGRDRR